MKCDTCKMQRVCDELERMGKVPKHEKCRCYTPAKPVTNADRIRAMTDEELADALTNIGVRTLRLHKLPVAEPVIEQAKEDWLNWLKQEANDAL